jgi:AcrR family transcriptional regulator
MSVVSTAASGKPLSRRDRKKGETRKRILDAAHRLMGERGYDAVRIEEIAEAADISNATFFHYFPTKAAILTAFIEAIVAELSERLAREKAGPEEKLRLIQHIVFQNWSKNNHFAPRIFAAFVLEPETDFDIEHPQTGLTGLVGKVFREGQKAGTFHKKFDPEVAAVVLISSWIGLARVWLNRSKPAQTLKATTLALDILLGGIRAG